MDPFFSSKDIQIYHGAALAVLKTMTTGSVDCIVTSPPYWNKRQYGTDPAVWGGGADCVHEWREDRYYVDGGATESKDRMLTGEAKKISIREMRWKVAHRCQCGAWLGELGQEPTPVEFVAHLGQVLAECKRILKPAGTLWLNLGDTFDRSTRKFRGKSLALIPQRIMIAMSDAGWCVRSEIVWVKPNAQTEPAKDRPTQCWEPIILASKAEKYWFDADALIEPARTQENRQGRDQWEIGTARVPGHRAPFPRELARRAIAAGCPPGGTVLDPFAGSGTALEVAQSLGRKAIGIEISADSCAIAATTCGQQYINLVS